MDGSQTLHQARLQRNIGLAELSAQTALSCVVLRKIDEGRFDELPPGLYARAYVKSFASGVGLDPVEALKIVEHLLPGAPDPLPVLRELKKPTSSDPLVRLLQRIRKTGNKPSAPPDAQPIGHDTIEGEPPGSARLLRLPLTHVAAAAIDAILLVAMNAALVLLVALGTGVPPRALLRHGSAALGALCSVPTVLYFILFNGIGGRTLGRWLCRLPEPPLYAPLTLDAILRRSVAPGSPPDTPRDGLSHPALVGRGS